jgi:hypothetical protein
MLMHLDHMTVAVSDIDAMIAGVAAAGVRLLVFLEGPEGIVVELAEWT